MVNAVCLNDLILLCAVYVTGKVRKDSAVLRNLLLTGQDMVNGYTIPPPKPYTVTDVSSYNMRIICCDGGSVVISFMILFTE